MSYKKMKMTKKSNIEKTINGKKSFAEHEKNNMSPYALQLSRIKYNIYSSCFLL